MKVVVGEPAVKPEASRRPSLSVCVMTRAGPERLLNVLELLRPFASELVVALDDRAKEAAGHVATVADEIVLFPYRDPGDCAIPWLHSLCRGSWILNVDDDEVPSEALLEQLPNMLAREVTHWWLPRRWLVGNGTAYLAEPPWIPDYQLRLYRNDAATLRFSDEFHRPVACSGPAGFARHPLWHLDCVLNSFERRRDKALAYERARRGMRIGGLSHNSGLYLPELRPSPRTARVPEKESLRIAAALARDGATSSRAPGRIRTASRPEVDRVWPGAPFSPGLYEARLAWVEPIERLAAGATHTVTVEVTNRGDTLWRFGPDVTPLIQVGTRWIGTRWIGDDGIEVDGIHTPLPSDVAPGDAVDVPVHVRAPAEAGRYRLVVDLVHEHVRWFGAPIEVEVAVTQPHRVALIGTGDALERELDRVVGEPDLEPVVLARGDAVRDEQYGPARAPGLGGHLLAGIDGPITASALAAMSWRTVRLLRRARSLRVAKSSAPLAEPAEECLRVLAGCERLRIASADWRAGAATTRELWRLAATAAAARRLGLLVDVDRSGFPRGHGLADRLLARLVR